MRLWFKRTKADARGSARDQVRKARGRPPRQKHSGPPTDDPIKNWESSDQAFLRQAGDPFDG